jgi:hypothetical protein
VKVVFAVWPALFVAALVTQLLVAGRPTLGDVVLTAFGSAPVALVGGLAIIGVHSAWRWRRAIRAVARAAAAAGLDVERRGAELRWSAPLGDGDGDGDDDDDVRLRAELTNDVIGSFEVTVPLPVDLGASACLLEDHGRSEELAPAVAAARDDADLLAAWDAASDVGVLRRLEVERDVARFSIPVIDDSELQRLPGQLAPIAKLLARVRALARGPLAELRACPACAPSGALVARAGDEQVLRCTAGHGVVVEGARAGAIHAALGDPASVRERVHPHEQRRPCSFCGSQMSAESPLSKLLLCEGCGCVCAPEDELAALVGMPLDDALAARDLDVAMWTPLPTPPDEVAVVAPRPPEPTPARVMTVLPPGDGWRVAGLFVAASFAGLLGGLWDAGKVPRWPIAAAVLPALALSSSMMWGWRGLLVDRDRRQVARFWGVTLLPHLTLPLLRSWKRIENVDRVTIRASEVTLDGRDDDAQLTLLQTTLHGRRRRVAERVARCLELDVVDAARGARRRSPHELHLSALESARARGETTTSPGAPPEGISALPPSDGQIAWEISFPEHYRHWPTFLYTTTIGALALGTYLVSTTWHAIDGWFVPVLAVGGPLLYLAALLRWGVRAPVVALDRDALTVRTCDWAVPWRTRFPLDELEEIVVRDGLDLVSDRSALRVAHLDDDGARWLARELLYRWRELSSDERGVPDAPTDGA